MHNLNPYKAASQNDSPPTKEGVPMGEPVQSAEGDPGRVKQLTPNIEYYWPDSNVRPMFRFRSSSATDWFYEEEFRRTIKQLSIPLDDPALRELVEAIEQHREQLYGRIAGITDYNEEDKRLYAAFTALTAAYPSLASPETGAE